MKRVASNPQNPLTPSARRPPRPIPTSLSHSSDRGMQPSWSDSTSHTPASRAGERRDGDIIAVTKEAAVAGASALTSNRALPLPTGYRRPVTTDHTGPIPPGLWSRWSTGPAGLYSRHRRDTLWRHQVIESVQPTRSAGTLLASTYVHSATPAPLVLIGTRLKSPAGAAHTTEVSTTPAPWPHLTGHTYLSRSCSPGLLLDPMQAPSSGPVVNAEHLYSRGRVPTFSAVVLGLHFDCRRQPSQACSGDSLFGGRYWTTVRTPLKFKRFRPHWAIVG